MQAIWIWNKITVSDQTFHFWKYYLIHNIISVKNQNSLDPDQALIYANQTIILIVVFFCILYINYSRSTLEKITAAYFKAIYCIKFYIYAI